LNAAVALVLFVRYGHYDSFESLFLSGIEARGLAKESGKSYIQAAE
jgi:hypothetical protein